MYVVAILASLLLLGSSGLSSGWPDAAHDPEPATAPAVKPTHLRRSFMPTPRRIKPFIINALICGGDLGARRDPKTNSPSRR
ncbi:MAG: hypothetical protein R3D55_01265 [Chloroflexota bacterium]